MSVDGPASNVGRGPRASATSLLTTMLGEFVRPAGGRVWTTTVVDGMGVVGIAERNARQSLARLRDGGLIDAERVGRAARWLLTDAGTRVLSTGAERIYGFGARAESWDGRWLVVVCSIPERERAKRHRLRTRLTFEGFGFATPSVAVCPHRDRELAANAILAELGLGGEALTLDARTGVLTSDRQMIESAWELDALADGYRAFTARFADVRPGTPQQAFGATIRLVDAWRHFPFRDPELPVELLPADWPGFAARHLFVDRHERWGAAAREWYDGAEDERRVAMGL